ncbi:hypothetical protein F4803DRAFT_545440 [Xylaria telfairii]|nr:hypothetical protein F4803DRAFT_545440 [Xylaria telfairii]
MPSAQGQQQVLNALARIERQLGRMDGRLNGLEGQMKELNVRVRSGETNAVARLWNSRATGPGQEIQPLIPMATGEAINGFPTTTTNLNGLSMARVTDILRLLEQPTGGTLNERRQRLRLVCGITMQWS